MPADVVWIGLGALFLIFEISAAVLEHRTIERLTLSRNVWRWFDTWWEKAVLMVFGQVTVFHLVFEHPGGWAVIATGAPIVIVVARESFWALRRRGGAA